jgi:hypothetical protein
LRGQIRAGIRRLVVARSTVRVLWRKVTPIAEGIGVLAGTVLGIWIERVCGVVGRIIVWGIRSIKAILWRVVRWVIRVVWVIGSIEGILWRVVRWVIGIVWGIGRVEGILWRVVSIARREHVLGIWIIRDERVCRGVGRIIIWGI